MLCHTHVLMILGFIWWRKNIWFLLMDLWFWRWRRWCWRWWRRDRRRWRKREKI